jgi:hypothetical protein
MSGIHVFITPESFGREAYLYHMIAHHHEIGFIVPQTLKQEVIINEEILPYYPRPEIIIFRPHDFLEPILEEFIEEKFKLGHCIPVNDSQIFADTSYKIWPHALLPRQP